jgi:hypothetical protein
MKQLTATAVLVLASGCVSFPIPPVGDDPGRYGYVDIKVQYRPNFDTVWTAFKPKQQPKPTSSK